MNTIHLYYDTPVCFREPGCLESTNDVTSIIVSDVIEHRFNDDGTVRIMTEEDETSAPSGFSRFKVEQV